MRRGSGGWESWMFVVALSLLSLPVHAGCGTEILIVDNPERLTVLNRYQQNLSPQDRSLLRPFTPMKILRERALLGDGFTPCARVEIEGVEFFLIRESDGRLAGQTSAGTLRRYSGEFFSDTVRVLKDGVLRFAAADGRAEYSLEAGEKIVRVFSSGGRTYVKRTGRSPLYGWVSLPSGTEDRFWGTAPELPVTGSAIPSRIRDSVNAILTRTNLLLNNLYAFFNRTTRQNRAAPRWQMEASPAALACVLAGASPERDFPESSRYLVRDLESLLLGSHLGLHRSPGRIEIRSE